MQRVWINLVAQNVDFECLLFFALFLLFTVQKLYPCLLRVCQIVYDLLRLVQWLLLLSEQICHSPEVLHFYLEQRTLVQKVLQLQVWILLHLLTIQTLKTHLLRILRQVTNHHTLIVSAYLHYRKQVNPPKEFQAFHPLIFHQNQPFPELLDFPYVQI